MARHRVDAPLTAAAMYLLPLAAAPERLLHPGPWIGFLAAVVTLQSQPKLSFREMTEGGGPDRRSAPAIFVTMVAVQLVAVLDFGYGPGGKRAGLLDGALDPWAGPGLVVGGLALRLSAIRTLGRWFTSVVRVGRDQPLVRTGVYKLIRHPSYTGALLAALGVACALGSALSAGLVLLVGVPAYLYRIDAEERLLLAMRGEEYASYRNSTWRLIPFVY